MSRSAHATATGNDSATSKMLNRATFHNCLYWLSNAIIPFCKKNNFLTGIVHHSLHYLHVKNLLLFKRVLVQFVQLAA